MTQPSLTTDLCIKCNLCTVSCPVAAATDRFLGPKAVGPQAQRFRHPRLPLPDDSVGWCSGCGTCTLVCPHGVQVAEMNIQAKARLAQQSSIPIRDHFISRPDLLGRLATPVAPLANGLLRLSPVRELLERTLGISREAPLPVFARPSLRRRLRSYCINTPLKLEELSRLTVAYFHGCSGNYYEPELGELAVLTLEKFGLYVFLPPQVCCGLPLQSNGMFEAARRYARRNIRLLTPFIEEKIPVVGTSTSCTLSLKHDFHAVLGLEGDHVQQLAASTYDFFELLTENLQDELNRMMYAPVRARALYHPPCQLRSHGIGMPAVQVLRRIPGLRLELSTEVCCGVAGTYGVKAEKYKVAYEVGRKLFQQANDIFADMIITDSETCRWWLQRHTTLPVFHPLEILARSLGIA